MQLDPETSLLTLTQWLSPSFPTGAFAYSHGLEVPMATRAIADAESLFKALCDLLTLGSARNDAILLAHAIDPANDPDALAATARALCASGERLRETEELGAALTRTTNALLHSAHPPRPYPVALGVAARALDLPTATVLRLFLQAFASGLTSAAVRFVPLGQTEGQQVLARLAPAILATATFAAAAPLAALASATFGADMASAAHETLEVRIFRT